MRVLVVGYHAWDVILPCTELPAVDRKQEYPGMITGGGGPGATAAVALARLGVEVEFLGVFGDDAPSQMHKSELVSEGVVIDRCPLERGSSSPLAVSLVDPATGSRRICWTRGSLRHLQCGDVEASWVSQFDLLLTDSHEPVAAAILAREAGRRGIPVVLDGGTPRDGMNELLPWVTDAIGSEIFAPGLTGHLDHFQALRQLATFGPKRVATTLGANGCLGLEDGHEISVPAFEVPITDTTGAGDAFHAGYVWGLLNGFDFEESLKAGSAVAALACGKLGGRAGLPGKDAVAALMRSSA